MDLKLVNLIPSHDSEHRPEFILIRGGWYFMPSSPHFKLDIIPSNSLSPPRYCIHEHEHNIRVCLDDLYDALNIRNEVYTYSSEFLIMFRQRLISRDICHFCRTRDHHYNLLKEALKCCPKLLHKIYLPFNDIEHVILCLQKVIEEMDTLNLNKGIQASMLDIIFNVIVEDIDSFVNEMQISYGSRYKYLRNELFIMLRDRRCYIKFKDLNIRSWATAILNIIASSDTDLIKTQSSINENFNTEIWTEFVMITTCYFAKETYFHVHNQRYKILIFDKDRIETHDHDNVNDMNHYHPLLRGDLITNI